MGMFRINHKKNSEFSFKFFILIFLSSILVASALNASDFIMFQFPNQKAVDLDKMFKRARDLAFQGDRKEAKVKYGYDHFNRGEEDFGPWHLASFDLSKKLKWGTVIGRINYANRNFTSISKSGPQFEIDLYPKITKGFYAYVNGGYSSSSVFPKYRFGGELYKSLPSGFEISAGARYLDFSTAKVLIYTGNLGKYYKNYLFSLRPFVTSKTSGIDISGILLIRKYQNNPRNYISLLLG